MGAFLMCTFVLVLLFLIYCIAGSSYGVVGGLLYIIMACAVGFFGVIFLSFFDE